MASITFEVGVQNLSMALFVCLTFLKSPELADGNIGLCTHYENYRFVIRLVCTQQTNDRYSSFMNVAILGSGDMGSAVASSLESQGISTLTCLAGRSDRSRELARAAGMTDVDDLRVPGRTQSDMLLSIMPPSAALQYCEGSFARSLPRSGKRIYYSSIATRCRQRLSTKSQTVANEHAVRFQDVGIIGPAPRPGRSAVRFYTSGNWNKRHRRKLRLT